VVGSGSLDGVVPSRMVGVFASVNLPLHHKVQKCSSGTGSPGWSRKKGHKTVVVWWWWWWYAKRLARKNISEMTYFVEWDVKQLIKYACFVIASLSVMTV